MGQVLAFFSQLFETNDWPPRWLCGKWSEFHGWLYIFSDITIWLAYFIIPVIIIWFVQKQPKIPFSPIFFLFGAFILLCGTTHFIDAIIFWWPGYRVSALVRFITAIVSMMTVFALIKELPKMLNLELKTDSKEHLHNLDKMQQKWERQLRAKDQRIMDLTEEIKRLKSLEE